MIMNNKGLERSLFIFPGQGSQSLGMGTKLLDKFPKLKTFYDVGSEILGYDILDVIRNDGKKINETLYTQPSIFIDSLVKESLLLANNIFPNAVAGHSLGEYSALVSANVIDFEDALRIIKVRSYEMQNAGIENPGKMLALIGATHKQIKKICDQGKILVIANYNSYDQVVLSGDKDSIEKAIINCNEIGVRRAIPLKTSGAFHSPLMSSASKKVKEIIDSIKFNDATIPIYQNTNPVGEKIGGKIKQNLINQIENPVQWVSTINNMEKDNSNLDFIEVGNGKVLTKLNDKILKKSKTLTFNMINF
ncbi:MAG: [acyl-carrier-protein] S-malonyltransferase [Candidatus Marinimicrobia bacterium]|nr:[acyl-carrier-protein] S-malonyltransferase [Candidatus Neomarinimicrobiota bacterium]